MNWKSIAAVAVVAACATSLVASAVDTPAADLWARLQGAWQATAVSGGPGGRPGDPAGITMVVDGDHVLLSDHGREEKVTITVDGASSPAQFELKSDGGQHLVSGIVEVTADGLRMAFRKAGQGDRPTTFDAADGVSVLAFKRAAAATSRPAVAATTRP